MEKWVLVAVVVAFVALITGCSSCNREEEKIKKKTVPPEVVERASEMVTKTVNKKKLLRLPMMLGGKKLLKTDGKSSHKNSNGKRPEKVVKKTESDKDPLKKGKDIRNSEHSKKSAGSTEKRVKGR